MNRRSLIILTAFIALAFALSSVGLHASSPRKVLMEEGTNWDCGPCASQNPAYQTYLFSHLDNVVPICYHPNWPGPNDGMYLADPTMNQGRIATYYAVTGVPTCIVQGNAYQNSPTPSPVEAARQSVLAKFDSPITISIAPVDLTTANVTLNITVTSDAALSNKKLRIAVVEAWHHYDPAGSNGENDFYFVARKMLPDLNGTTINLAAGTPFNIQQSYANQPGWNTPLIYIAVWVQDDATKEVLQVGNTKIADPSMVTLSTQDLYLKVPPSTKTSKTITVNNPYSIPVTAGLAINSSSSYIPTGWTAALSTSTVTLPANGSQDVTVDVTSAAAANFAQIQVDATPQNLAPTTFPVPTDIMYFELNNNTKNLVWLGADDNGWVNSYTSMGNYNVNFGNVLAFAPLSIDAMSAWQPKDFDLCLFGVDYWNAGLLSSTSYSASNATIMAIEAAIDNNKKIIITDEYDLINSYGTDGSYASKDFFTNYLGIQPSANSVMRVTVNSSSQITGLLQYPIKGIASDPIGNGILFTGNAGSTSDGYGMYAVYTDLIGKTATSNAVPFLYYDNNTNNVGGVHIEKGLSRIVYMTSGFGTFKDAAQRDNLMAKILDWLEAAPSGAIISTISDSYYFDNTIKDGSSILTIDLNNTGNADLVVSGIQFDEPAFGFETPVTFPLTVIAGGSAQITLKFSPTDIKDYTGTMKIASNSLTGSEFDLHLNGTGIAGNGAYIQSNADNNSVDFGLETPHVKKLKDIEIKNAGTQALNMTLIALSTNDGGVFDIESPQTSGTLQPGNSFTVTVSFDPAEYNTVYHGTLSIISNAVNAATYDIALSGQGESDIYVAEPAVQNGVFTMNVAPNPITETGAINFNISGNENVNVTLNLIDVTGKVIAQLASGSRTPGDYSIDINAGSYTSGTYFVVGSVAGASVHMPVVIAK